MESNSLKKSSIKTRHSIELKFDVFVICHRPTCCTDSGAFWVNSFFYRSTKYSYSLQPMESNSKKHASV